MSVDSRLRPGVPGPLLSQLEHLELETEAPAPEKTLNHLESWCRPKSTARKSSEPEDAAATALAQAPGPGLEQAPAAALIPAGELGAPAPASASRPGQAKFKS